MASILIVNDDGINSPGLEALVAVFRDEVLKQGSQITVAAPDTQTSWIGKASSYNRSIEAEERNVAGVRGFALSGTPADCANAGIYHLCGAKPDIILSGINIGANAGDSYIFSSGTVGGAVEGILAGIPAIAAGVDFGHDTTMRMEFGEDGHPELFSTAASLAFRLAMLLLGYPGTVPAVVFNLNLPETVLPGKGVEITRPARYSYGSFLERKGNIFRHKGAAKDYSVAEEGTDMAAIRGGHPSLSLLELIETDPVTDEFITYLEKGLNGPR